MSTLAFIAELVKALSWPVAAIVIASIFHRQISGLLARIRKGKFGSAELEFEMEVQELAQHASAQVQEQQVGSEAVSLATTNPRAAIVDAWLGLEAAVTKLTDNGLLPPSTSTRSPLAIIRSVEKLGILEPIDVALFNDLRVLRNHAIHDAEFSPSTESVIKYVQIAQALRARIERAASES